MWWSSCDSCRESSLGLSDSPTLMVCGRKIWGGRNSRTICRLKNALIVTLMKATSWNLLASKRSCCSLCNKYRCRNVKHLVSVHAAHKKLKAPYLFSDEICFNIEATVCSELFLICWDNVFCWESFSLQE